MEEEVPLLNIGLHCKRPEDLVCADHASAVLYPLCTRAEEQLFNAVRPSYLQPFTLADFLVTATDTIQKRMRLVEHFRTQWSRSYHTMRVLMENDS